MTKQRFGCIYRVTNLVTKKTYIGKTVRSFKRRMYEHKHYKCKTYLSKSIQKHGWNNFKKEIVIDDVPEEDLSNLEIYYIKVENTFAPNGGYNLTLGGDGTAGYKFSKKSRENCRQAAIRRNANRDQVGTVGFDKKHNKYTAVGPYPDKTSIGRYFTKEKAINALNHFNVTGKRIESDRTTRKKGTGSIKTHGKRHQARYTKNKKTFTKTLDTVEECEEWLKTELKF